ncbi:MAG TPA: hypothetical protein VFB63_21340, partial [Bryobacteraceae bacterium]|nr:hypothetical protein [Bryobacteraceae bacterium]
MDVHAIRRHAKFGIVFVPFYKWLNFDLHLFKRDPPVVLASVLADREPRGTHHPTWSIYGDFGLLG